MKYTVVVAAAVTCAVLIGWAYVFSSPFPRAWEGLCS